MRKTTLLLTLLAFTTVSALAQTMRTVTYRVAATATQEVPPIEGYQVVGDATFEITMQRDANGDLIMAIASFRVAYTSEEEQTPVAMHIHRGASGVNGPVVIHSGLLPGDLETATSGNIWRQNTITDPAGLAVVEEVLANPSGFYLNVHSAQHPPGFVRGQLQPMLAAGVAGNLQAVMALQDQVNAVDGKVDEIDRFLRELANSLGVVLR